MESGNLLTQREEYSCLHVLVTMENTVVRILHIIYLILKEMPIYPVMQKNCAVANSIMSSLGFSQQHQLSKELNSAVIKSDHLPHHPLVPDEAQLVGDQPNYRQLQ